MFGNIKSKLIFNKIFFHLVEKMKLKLVKYNKYYQNKINIKLINYKIFSDRYIIYNGDEKGKEYNGYDDDLRYEGEYINGVRNGKGKEFYYGDIVFEGEYLNGKRWNGEGKEYDENEKLKFDGEYLNPIRNGKGKEYNNGKLIFEGEYLNGEKNGKGIEYYLNSNINCNGDYSNLLYFYFYLILLFLY